MSFPLSRVVPCFPNTVAFIAVKDGQDVYLEVFHTELEAFKDRVKEYAVKCRGDTVNNAEQQNTGTNCRFDPKEAPLPPVSAPLFFPSAAETHRLLQLPHTAGRWHH